MFSDQSLDVVGFNSQLSDVKSEQSTSVQTTDIAYRQNFAQSVETRSIETQTAGEESKKPEINYDQLANFLKKVTPTILEALDETYGTNAFDDYNPKTTEYSLANTQFLQRISTANELDEQVKISDISWSTGGGTLAVSHGVAYHENWCDHLSKVQLYDYTNEYSFTGVPNKSLETNACITTISYHPVEPSILAAGLFNGDVLVWNLRDDVSVTPLTVCTHGDSVSEIFWKTRGANDVSLLVSSSKDGYILIHKMLANFTTVSLFKRFKIAKEHNPAESSRPRSASGTRERAMESGLCVTTFDFSARDPIFFIVGTLCGGIYKCSLDRIAPIEGDETLMDPVIDEYERHKGSVTCIKCSPIRNLFVTAGTDKEIRTYDFDQHGCLRSISVENTVVGLTWMFGNQDIFATYGAGSDITLYDVRNGKNVKNVKFNTTDRENTSSLSVNTKRDTIAIGDAKGNVEIWRIPRQLQ